MVSLPSWEDVATGIVTVLDPIYGEDAPLEFVAEAVTPITTDPVGTVTGTPEAIDVWLSEHLAEPAQEFSHDAQQAFSLENIAEAVQSVNPFQGWLSDPTTSPLTPYAEAYVDWYEGDTGTAEFISDPIGTIAEGIIEVGSGTGQEIEDIVTGGLETVPAIVESAGTAGATIIEPIADAGGDLLEDLAVPIAILGGAYLLTR